jgi:signal transduction histidine kinase
MDRLELLQLQHPELPIDPILDQLATLGTHLRQHLSRTNAIAVDITPELRNGLDKGIQAQLTELLESEELTLKVIQQLQPLNEPTLNSLWLEAREDIYRFFKEAIHNVIHHAQPPHGTATQVMVSLKQRGDQAMLIIENNGAFLDPKTFETTDQQRQRGGYGTKLMDTIAAELPDGNIRRIFLKEGGLHIQLTWKQFFIPNDE